MINSSRRPVIIAGVEMHRFGLGHEVVKLAEQAGIPMCATLLGKSVVSEKHPLYLGVYEGAMGRDRKELKHIPTSDRLTITNAMITFQVLIALAAGAAFAATIHH